MDKSEPSSSVLWFIDFLKQGGVSDAVGIEMGCGKGRNTIGFAKELWVVRMHGFDFSDVAIAEAARRAREAGVSHKADFQFMDATAPWHFASDSFDFGVDCAASTDIESSEGRTFAADEMFRVLKPGAFLLVMAMSEGDEYHAKMREESPAEERGAFLHSVTGKFEKVFTAQELDALHADFSLTNATRHETTVRFFGIPYAANLHWRIYQKPLQ